MRNRFNLLQLLILPLFAYATEPVLYKPLTSKSHPICEASHPCRIFENNGTFELSFDVIEHGSSRNFGTLVLVNLKDQSKQEFKLREINTIAQTSFFRVFQVSLRQNAKQDIAVLAYNSAREGEMYQYLIYNDQNEKFVLADQTAPKLEAGNSSSEWLSPYHKTKYILDAASKLVPMIR